MVTVEVCVESLSGVRAARAAGARRVELCAALGEGGLTPSAGLVQLACAEPGLAVVVLVRPRGGDFLYTEDESRVVEQDVAGASARGAAGVALGALTDVGEIDVPRCARWIRAAGALPVTFHRAFDQVQSPARALEDLVALGVARVLTSGQCATAWEGRERIAALVRAARGRLAVVAAGGVRPENVRALLAATGVAAVHFSASARVEGAMLHRNPAVRLATERASEAYAHHETDPERVRAMLAALEG